LKDRVRGRVGLAVSSSCARTLSSPRPSSHARIALRGCLRTAILLLLLLGVGACSSDDTYLPALLADPMADYSHPDLEVESRAEIEQGRTLIQLSESPAAVVTQFVLVGEADPVIEDAVAIADSNGWTFIAGSPFTGSSAGTWSAEKEMSEGLATLTITLLSPGTEDYDLTISLRFEDES
jgi:hypothetical protein